jgi:hypothetical protein
MKKLLSLLLILTIMIYADFLKTVDQHKKEFQDEQDHYCKVFQAKVIKYENHMRSDELAHITLNSYKKRANIYCTKQFEIFDEETKKIIPKKVKIVKDITLEDERLCKVFQNKLINYKKEMREDELAYTTLNSYKKRTQIFCSKESLEKKEKGILKENENLCKLFKQGPILCEKFHKEITCKSDDALAIEALHSFKQRANIFCSSKTLKEKDLEVHKENNRLCQVFKNKILAYKKEMRNDDFSKVTLDSYKKRATYFCETINTKDEDNNQTK